MSTLALTHHAEVDLQSMIGSSIQWSRYFWPQSRFAIEEQAIYANKPSAFSVSSGISVSAHKVQQQVEELAVELHSWSTTHETIPVDVEHEVFTLMPPKQQQVVTVQVQNQGRANPLICLDDVMTDFDNI